MRDRAGLAVQVVTATLIVALVTGTVTALVLLGQVRGAAVAQQQSTLARQADLVAESVERGVGGPSRPIRLIPLLERQGITAVVLTGDGQTTPSLTDDATAALLAEGTVSTVTDVDGTATLVEGRSLPGGAIVLSQPVSVADTVGENRRRILVGVGVGLLTAGLVGWLLARRISRPVRRAADAANALAAGDRAVEVVAEGPAEVAELADALNRLVSALALSEERQRQFLLSISHELRTPLTAIRGYSEALADGAIPSGQVGTVGATLQSESDRLDRLVSDLLDLARLQADQFRVELIPIDAAELIGSAASVWADRCRAADVAFESITPTEPLEVSTDPTRLRQVVDGLMENALRVTPAGAPIVLELRAGAAVTVEVRDGGPGLSDDDLAVAFERGVLNDRYRGLRPVGTGLGLALAAGLVRRLGGAIEAGHAPEGGARFTVTLPPGDGILTE